jgi:hypothetical protein
MRLSPWDPKTTQCLGTHQNRYGLRPQSGAATALLECNDGEMPLRITGKSGVAPCLPPQSKSSWLIFHTNLGGPNVAVPAFSMERQRWAE